MPANGGKIVRIFISSPGDTQFERMRVDRVVERLNGEFAKVARLVTVRWEREFYKAHETFQAQIPEAATCDIVIGILRHRLGTALPAEFAHMADGEPYPSGTAYEILTAIDAARQKGHPDVYVFRCPDLPTVTVKDDDPENIAIKQQWKWLEAFCARWFRSSEGDFKAAYHEFHTTDEFEAQFGTLLRKWLEGRAPKGHTVTWPVATKGSPFRGLASFGATHAPVFFGRGRDITRGVDTLKDAADAGTPFLLLVGPSGSGKSSLARAGLVPRLTTPGVLPYVDVWRVATMRPRENAGGPIAALATHLLDGDGEIELDDEGRPCALPEMKDGDYGSPEKLARLLDHADDSAALPIVGALDRIGESERETTGHDRSVRVDLVLLVDQLDELFGGDPQNGETARFAALLSALMASGRVWVIATLRANLYERFLKEPALLDLKTRGRSYDVSPPSATELDDIVRGPATAAGLVYETNPETGESLDERLLRDADRPDMLPLLQFVLDQLYEQRTTVDGAMRLTFAAYDSFGGIDGAIDRAGEQAIAALTDTEKKTIPKLLRLLVRQSADAGFGVGSSDLILRSVPLAEIERDPAMGTLVRALADARMLVTGNDGTGSTVRLAHQRIVESWSRAAQAVRQNRDYYRMLGDLRAQFGRWIASGGHPSTLVAKGRPLGDARDLGRRFRREMDPQHLAFVKASTWRRYFVFGVAWIVPSIIIALALSQGLASAMKLQEPQANLASYVLILIVVPGCLALAYLMFDRRLSQLVRGGLKARIVNGDSGLGCMLAARKELVDYNAVFLLSLPFAGLALIVLEDDEVKRVLPALNDWADWAWIGFLVVFMPAGVAWALASVLFRFRLRRSRGQYRAGTAMASSVGTRVPTSEVPDKTWRGWMKRNSPVLVMGACGLVSGVLSVWAFPMKSATVPQYTDVRFYLPAIFLGLILAFGEWRWARIPLVTGVLIVFGTFVAWVLAYTIGFQAVMKLKLAWRIYLLMGGLVGGAIGGSITAVILPTLLPCRRWALATVGGAILGMILYADQKYGTVFLYPVWQGALATYLGWWLQRSPAPFASVSASWVGLIAEHARRAAAGIARRFGPHAPGAS